MARALRGKRVRDPSDGSFVVVDRAPRGQPDPYFDTARNVWVAPWRKADGRLGKPTGRTRAAAEASRNRHIADEAADAKLGPLADGFHVGTTLAELGRWWLDHVAVHRVRVTTWSTYDKQLRLVGARLGNVPVRRLRADQVATRVSELAKSGSASRARNVRGLLAQVLDEAVNLGLADDHVATKVRSPRVPKVQRRTLSPAEVSQLLAVCDERYAAAVALCFVQGWRVSEALGLAWQDIDLDAGAVRLRRGSTYADGIGMVLGPPKTNRTAGRQLLAPTALALLRAHRERWLEMRDRSAVEWPETTYQGETLDLVFVNQSGKPMLRQHIDKAIREAAQEIGISALSATPMCRQRVATFSQKASAHRWSRVRPSRSSTVLPVVRTTPRRSRGWWSADGGWVGSLGTSRVRDRGEASWEQDPLTIGVSTPTLASS